MITSILQSQIEYSNQDTQLTGEAGNTLIVTGTNVTTPVMLGLEIVNEYDGNSLTVTFNLTNTTGADIVWDSAVAGGPTISFNTLTAPGLVPSIALGDNLFHKGKFTFKAGETISLKAQETSPTTKTVELRARTQISDVSNEFIFQDQTHPKMAGIVLETTGVTPIDVELKLLVERDFSDTVTSHIAHITNKMPSAVNVVNSNVSMVLVNSVGLVPDGTSAVGFDGQNTVSGLWQVNETVTLKVIV